MLPTTRILATIVASLVTSTLFMTILFFSPQILPTIKESVASNQGMKNGHHLKKDWLGVPESQWNYANGLLEKEAVQYYPNGSLLREMNYKEGKLEGEVREYHEKSQVRRIQIQDFVPTSTSRQAIAGTLRAVWYYKEGKRHGPYEIYHSSGFLKERGHYDMGKKVGRILKFNEQGLPE